TLKGHERTEDLDEIVRSFMEDDTADLAMQNGTIWVLTRSPHQIGQTLQIAAN
ncbi:MAG: hypothetical protein HQK57_10135, partial [Deltaproteobacteria bacterium]|nr:hypothetical protein [Deltaproteobacteria bacterium]